MSREEWLQAKRNSLNGKKFGMLTVIGYSHTVGKHSFYKCVCDCGKEIITRRDGLVNGHTSSCGCVRDEWSHSGKLNRKHGLYKDRAYWVWAKVKSRCYNPKSREYENYGGRGITMCDEWLNPENFVKWAYETGYDANLPKGVCTLDRIDVDKNYEPSNCRWITNKQQQNNRRDNRRYSYNGEEHTIAEWSEILNVPYGTLRTGLVIYEKPLTYYINDYVPRKRK